MLLSDARLCCLAGLIGLGYACALGCVNILETLTNNQCFHILMRIVVQLKVPPAQAP